MARRSKYRNRSRVWPWVSFIIFSAVVTLLGYSIVKKMTPAAVIKSIFKSDIPEDDIRRLNKKELIELINTKENEISNLQLQLKHCIDDDGYEKGIITTTSSTLNMRSQASLQSDVIIKIPTGSKVSILYYDTNELFLDGAMGYWCRIKYADQEGWVWGNYVINQE